MIDSTLFCRFIENCLSISVTAYNGTDEALHQFEQQNCFDSTLQPMYTADYLKKHLVDLQPQVFYEITDAVHTHLILFSFEDTCYLAGPYVSSITSDHDIHELLASHKLDYSIAEQLKHYCTAFPLLQYSYVTGIILSAMRAFIPGTPEYQYQTIQEEQEHIDDRHMISSAEKSHQQIVLRYQYENAFLKMIQEGKEKEVMDSLHSTTAFFQKDADRKRHALYETNHEGFTVLRTLVRKAAENGGCPVTVIDAITQEAIQKASNCHTSDDIAKVQMDMIIRLTRAVAKNKSYNRYSSVIRKVLIHIEENFSKELSLSVIAEEFLISKEHLARLFKKETGQTVTEFLAETRCRNAAELLTATTLSIAEIAEFVGYADNNYFVKVFKKQYGVPPSVWRKKPH